MADPKSESKEKVAAVVQGATPRNRQKAAPKPGVVVAIPGDCLVKYQMTDKAFLLPVKCAGKWAYVRSDKPSEFNKKKFKHQMLLTIEQEIKAGRMKEVA